MLSFHPKQQPSANTVNDIELPLDDKVNAKSEDNRVVSLDEFRKKKNL